MLNDTAGLMRKMWAARPFEQRRPSRQNCFEVKRDDPEVAIDASRYFRETFSGVHCGSNWYSGNPDELGAEDSDPPTFTRDAPALLGFDETIDDYCSAAPETNPSAHQRGGHWHASHCIASNLNILSLYGETLPYNICRNLEWQVCGALGRIPGQGLNSRHIVFSRAPKDLEPGVNSNKPFGQCRGWRPTDSISCDSGYATDDIFFLEACIFNQICSNGEELWSLNVGDAWRCDLDSERFAELQAMLVAEPTWHDPDGLPPRCDSWCNQWTCSAPECSGCARLPRCARRSS